MADARNQARRWKIRSYDEQQHEQEQKSRGSSIFRPVINLPDGVKFFKFPEGANYVLLDVIPFLTDYTGELELRSEAQYWRHHDIGQPYPQNILCPKRTFGLPCPICDARSKLNYDDPDDRSLADAWKPKERRLYFVRWLNGPAENKGDLFILDQSQFSFGNLIKNKLAMRDRDDPVESNWDNFFDLQNGFMLKVGLSSDLWRGRAYMKPVSIDFKPRAYSQYAKSVEEEEAFLKTVPDMYKCLNALPYDEINEIFQSGHRTVDVPLNTSPTQQRKAVNLDPTKGYSNIVHDVPVFTSQRAPNGDMIEDDAPF